MARLRTERDPQRQPQERKASQEGSNPCTWGAPWCWSSLKHPHEGMGLEGPWVQPVFPVNVPRVGSGAPVLQPRLPDPVSPPVQWAGSRQLISWEACPQDPGSPCGTVALGMACRAPQGRLSFPATPGLGTQGHGPFPTGQRPPHLEPPGGSGAGQGLPEAQGLVGLDKLHLSLLPRDPQARL